MIATNRDRLVASLATLSILVRVLAGLYLVPAVLSLIAAAYIFAKPFYAYQIGLFIGLLGIGGNALFLLCGIVFLVWTYRAHDNLARFGLEGLTYSPGWAAGSFLVPFANLVVPFRAMRELWNRSHGEDEWQARAGVSEVTSWWACLIAGTFLGTIQYFALALNTLTNIIVMTPPAITAIMALLGQTLNIGAAILLIRIVGAITAAQRTDAGVGNAFA